uniref:Uncharacterized protein n=1 Tax=Paramormyrops kingsleyae TaxID=1676925 RepID=A0A3B3SS79_9TELE
GAGTKETQRDYYCMSSCRRTGPGFTRRLPWHGANLSLPFLRMRGKLMAAVGMHWNVIAGIQRKWMPKVWNNLHVCIDTQAYT